MKIVAVDKNHVDYFQGVYTSQRGVTSCFGVRVSEGHCNFVVKIGNGSPDVVGNDYSLPVDLELLPSHVRIIVDSHLLNYPSSDLWEALTGRKSFQEVLRSAAETAPNNDSKRDRPATEQHAKVG